MVSPSDNLLAGLPALRRELDQTISEHDRGGFSCGQPTLDQFLEQFASQHAKRDFSRTYVAVLPPAFRVLGYYSLSSGSFDLSVLPKAERRKLPRHPVPVAHLGRLAVDKSTQGQGLVAFVLLDALARCERLADAIGLHAVEVRAIDAAARNFYLKYGFEPLLDDVHHLYLPMKAIRKLALNRAPLP
jgi:ribosomal protein S18 acetylase RimI-like enzyme